MEAQPSLSPGDSALLSQCYPYGKSRTRTEVSSSKMDSAHDQEVNVAP